jgi:hypothetical protein
VGKMLQKTQKPALQGHRLDPAISRLLHQQLRQLPWVDALEAIDLRGDKTLLCSLLRNPEAELSPDVRDYLADLIERKEFKRRQGRQKVAAYAVISETNWRWELGCSLTRSYIQSGDPEDTALDKAAAEISRSREQLKSVFHGKHGAFNRSKKRRSKS